MTKTTDDGFSACDMATAAADGFRDGVASVRPGHVEDVRAMVVPEGWREFIAECAGMAGGMVNGNRLSLRAQELLAAAPTPEQPAKEAQ